MSRIDLHVHSKHSNDPAEWYLRGVRAPESYTEPREVYRRALARGMDFVTISDHDSIAGALEIAHLPGAFLSNEVTTTFPEDGCEVHCLVFGISEGQHREIDLLRRNIYELRDYLRQEGIAHSVAHPLFRVNGRLTLSHFERLIVLFDRFESLNGMHDRRANEVTRRILSSLTRKAVEDAAERHGLEPFGPTPWEKRLTGGSDDHGGYYIAATYTCTPEAATVAELLDHLRAGRCEAGGESGSSARLMQSLYGIGYEYYRRLFPAILGNRKDPFVELLRKLAEGAGRRDPGERLEEREGRTWPRRASVWVRRRLGLESAAQNSPTRAPMADRFAVRKVGKLGRDAYSSLLSGAFGQLRRGRIAGSLGELAHLAPLALSLAPYFVSVRSLHKDRDLLEEASLRFLGSTLDGPHAPRRAWFTDSLAASGEVSEKLRLLTRLVGGGEVSLVVAGKPLRRPQAGSGVATFAPLGELPLPLELGGGTLALPPLFEILDHCERERFGEIVVDTASPWGLAGVLAGKLLGLRLVGLFDSDLPSRLQAATGSSTLEGMAWGYLRWFFGLLDRTYVASRSEQRTLLARGFDPKRLRLLPALSARGHAVEPAREERMFALESLA